MEQHYDLNPVYARHDLMIEIGRLEMALDILTAGHTDQQDMHSRMSDLREELGRLS